MNANSELDVNALMTQIRAASPAKKAVVPPSPPRSPGVPPHPQKRNGAPDPAQESFNQQTIGILKGLAAVSGDQKNELVQLRQEFNQQTERLNACEEQLQNHPRRAARPAPVYLGNRRLFVQTEHELPLICPTDDLPITRALICEGGWDLPLTRLFMRFIKPGMTYLEIGTHIGYFTTLAAALVGHHGKIHAFEPNPATFELLEANMSLNKCIYLSQLIPKAVSNQSGATTFHVFNKNPGNSTLSTLPDQLLNEWRERPTEVQVPCTTLDDFYAGENLQFDFIKIDAEGAEPLIFEGGPNFLQHRIKPTTLIAMEYNPPAIQGLQRDPKKFAQSLFAAGFRLWRIVDTEHLQPVASPEELDNWCISELLLSRGELPA